MPLVNCLINGQAQTQLNAEDRAIHYGDGLFETMLYQHGKIALWKQHYSRLDAGCKVLGLANVDEKTLLKDLETLTKKLSNECYLIKLIISRGAAGRGLHVDKTIAISRIFLAYDFDVKALKSNKPKQLTLCKIRLMRNKTLGGIKHLNRLNYVLAADELDAKFDEGIMLNDRDELVECITNNLFFIKEKTIFTAPIDDCGVAGIKRQQVIDTAKDLGIMVCIKAILFEDLKQMDECFITNAVVGLQSVASIDSVDFTKQAMTQKLQKIINK